MKDDFDDFIFAADKDNPHIINGATFNLKKISFWFWKIYTAQMFLQYLL